MALTRGSRSGAYGRALETALHRVALPYGYTVTVRGRGAALTRSLGYPISPRRCCSPVAPRRPTDCCASPRETCGPVSQRASLAALARYVPAQSIWGNLVRYLGVVSVEMALAETD